jgi:hypothetical protein
MAIEARRHNPRTKLNGTSPIKFASGTTGVVLDVSEGGLRFETAAPLNTKEPVRFWLGSEHPTEGTADVAWSNDTKTVGGLHFEKLSPDMRLQIRNWIDGLEALPSAGRKTMAANAGAAATAAPVASRAAAPRVGTVVVAPSDGASKVALNESATAEIPATEIQEVQTVKTPATEALHNSFSSLSTSTLGLGRQSGTSPSEVGRLLDETPVPSVTLRDRPPLSEASRVEPSRVEPSRVEEVKASPSIFDSTTANSPSLGATTRASGGSLSMFPMERTPTGGFVTVKESQHRAGITVLVVLIVLAGAAAAFAYFRPVQTRELMDRAQTQIEQYIHMVRSGHSGNQQPASQAPPHSGTAMANPADNPEMAGMPPGFQQGSAEPGTAAPGATGADTGTNGSAWSNTGSAGAPMGPNAGSAGTADTESKRATANDGSSDLALAQAYLQPGSSTNQKQEGVKLLWGATEKGNVDAEIQLADLYKDGIAVPKSCVQARILLKAAAAANPTAAQSKLDDLDKANCN